MTQKEFSRREFYVESAKRVAVLAAAAVGGFWYGGQRTRGELTRPGDLSHELAAKLETAGYTFIYIPIGESVETMRQAGAEISPFPSTQGQPDFEKAISQHKWIAINPDEFHLPSADGEVDLNPRALGTLVRGRQTVLQAQFGREIQFILGQVVDYAGLDHAYQLATGEGLISGEGFIITGTRIEDSGIGVGRRTPGDPLSYSIFDASTREPTPPPDRLLAAGLVVPKLS